MSRGRRLNYRSIDTQVLGLVIRRATHQSLAGYLSEKVWKPLGMSHDAYITIDSRKHHHSHAFGGIAISAMDTARIGRALSEWWRMERRRIVREKWIRESIAYDTTNDGYHLCLVQQL